MGFSKAISLWNRERKWRTFMEKTEPGPDSKVLDVGFGERSDYVVGNYIESHYPWLENLTALGLEEAVEFSRRYPQVRAVRYDGGIFPFSDKEFDVVWSSAVIEHVGNFERQVLFVKEMCRVGRRVFFTTPNRWFPVELHTRLPLVHWLPKPTGDRLLRRWGRGFAAGDYMHLLGKSDIARILAAAGAGPFEILSNRFLGWTLDFSVVVHSPK